MAKPREGKEELRKARLHSTASESLHTFSDNVDKTLRGYILFLMIWVSSLIAKCEVTE